MTVAETRLTSAEVKAFGGPPVANVTVLAYKSSQSQVAFIITSVSRTTVTKKKDKHN